MNKLIRLLLVVALAISMLCPSFVVANAAGSVTYTGRSELFVFAPGSDHSPTDLFDGFKGVLPGDTRTQKVHIVNDVKNEVKVMIYMRALGAHEGSEEFLSQMELTVDVTDGERLFKAPADQKATLEDWVCLGTFYSGSKVDLDLNLHFDINAGNEFQNNVGMLDWEFKVEEYDIEPDDPKPPITGDNNHVYFYIGLCTVSVVFVFFIIFAKRKREDEEEATA